MTSEDAPLASVALWRSTDSVVRKRGASELFDFEYTLEDVSFTRAMTEAVLQGQRRGVRISNALRACLETHLAGGQNPFNDHTIVWHLSHPAPGSSAPGVTRREGGAQG